MKSVKISLLALIVFILAIPSCSLVLDGDGDRFSSKSSQDQIVNFQNDFLQRYRRLIDSKTKKAFNQLKTDEERQSFVDNFWKERDPNPSTKENEFKQSYDQRIKDIETEVFFQDLDLRQFLFKNNDGLDGDPAWVYLLFGKPLFKADLLEVHNRTIDLMVWVYVDRGGGVYRFLFYRSFGQPFRVFDFYFGNLLERLERITGLFVHSSDFDTLYRILQEIEYSQNGNVFISALYEFSSYGSSPGQVLAPPTPASLVARQSGIRIVGLPGLLDSDQYILSDSFKSFLPFVFGITTDKTTNQIASYILLRYSDIDWQVFEVLNEATQQTEKKIRAPFLVRMTFVRKNDRKVFIYEVGIKLSDSVDKAKSDKAFPIFISSLKPITGTELPGQIKHLSELPSGDYRVDLYLRNELTKRYSSKIVDYSR